MPSPSGSTPTLRPVYLEPGWRPLIVNEVRRLVKRCGQFI